VPAEATRAKLIEATARVMRERGLTGTTIREIAREAGLAEGALYRHFPDKIELIRAVMLEKWPSLAQTMARLLDSVGSGSVRSNLETAVVEAVDGYRELLPFVATISNDADVLAAMRQEFAARRIGPVRAHDAVVMYLDAEVEHGRVRLTAPAPIISAALLGACHEYAFIQLLHPATPFPDDPAEFARQLVGALLPA
jgi:AcrR family transcriptional regulator